MKPESVPGQVLELVLDGVIVPVLNKTIIEEYHDVSLAFGEASDKKQAIKTSDKRIYEIQKEMIVEYLTDKASAKAAVIADLLNVSPQRTRAVLSKMISEDLIVADGANRNRSYRLKS